MEPHTVKHTRNTNALTLHRPGEHHVILMHRRMSMPAFTGKYRTAYGARMALQAKRKAYAKLADLWGRDRRSWAEYGESLG